MFTRCPQCDTLFRVSATMLAAAQGDVRCGRCEAVFNALGHLRDDSEDGAESVQAPSPETTPEDGPEAGPPGAAAPGAAAGSADSLEFNVPEREWSQFFDDTHGLPGVEDLAADRPAEPGEEFEIRSPAGEPVPSASVESASDITTLEDETSDTDTWEAFLREVPLDEHDEPNTPVVVIEALPAMHATAATLQSQNPDESQTAALPEPPENVELAGTVQETDQVTDTAYPSVLRWGDRSSADAEPQGGIWWWAVGILLLLAAFGAQALHANRDGLAMDAQVGPLVRELYRRAQLTLYPPWPLASYEIRGAEAIAGRTYAGALDIVADIAMVGSQPAAAPLVRIVLRDRWSNIVGSRVVRPAEYSGDAQLSSRLLTPGSLVPVQISLADPGASAQGYELDLCIPDRRTGLRCQLAHDPYRH